MCDKGMLEWEQGGYLKPTQDPGHDLLCLLLDRHISQVNGN